MRINMKSLGCGVMPSAMSTEEGKSNIGKHHTRTVAEILKINTRDSVFTISPNCRF